MSLLIQYPRTLNNTIYQLNKQKPPPFFHSDTNTWPRSCPFCRQNPCSRCKSENYLVVVLNIFFLNYVPTRNKSLAFARFRRSYANHTAVVLTNHCQSCTVFFLDARCSKWLCFFFLSCLSPRIVHLLNLLLLSARVARMLLTRRWVSRRKDVKQSFINTSKLTIGVKYSTSPRTTFSPVPI